MPQLAGEDILASDIKVPGLKIKSGTESVTSSAALQNDNDLFVTLEPGIYEIRLYLHVTGDPAGDITVDWTTTGTITSLGRSGWAMAEGGTSATSTSVRVGGFNLNSAPIYGAVAVTTVVREELHVNVTATGVLQMRWAQGTSNGTATTLSIASRMVVTEMELI